jgi:hypothetical protein
LGATVYDSSGAIIPNATVVLKNEASNSTRESVTNSSGYCDFPAIPPGSYTVTVTAPNFASWEGRGIQITQGASVTLPSITLNVRGTQVEVTVVSASDMIVPVDTGQTSTTLNSRMISQVTMAGRDAAELIKLMPGMGFTNGLSQGARGFDPTTGTASNTGPIGAYSANGTQPNGGMTMTSDGANLLDPGNQGTQVANINADQTAEVTLLTSAYGAEFAKGPVTFQAIGKSGGARFHGQAYVYARNGVMNSTNSFLNSQGVPKPDDHYYYLGGDVGGPILIPGTGFNRNRDKLFFYAAYENMRQQTAGALHSYFMPSADMMGQASGKPYGDFSPAYLASLGPAWNNKYGSGGTFNVAPCGNRSNCSASTYPGGLIPLTLIDPNSLIYWKTYPTPNTTTTGNSIGANYQTLINPPQNRWELRLRGDYNISDNTKLFFSYNRQIEAGQNPINVWWWMGAALPYPSGMPATQVSQVYSANLTHVFSPTLTNEFVFAYASFVNPVNLTNPDNVSKAKLGFHMSNLFSGTYPYKDQLPNILGGWDGSNSSNAVPGYSAYTMGIVGYVADFGKTSQAPNISNNVSKVWGTHTLKAGFYWDFNRNWQTNGSISPSGQGTFTFFNYNPNTSGNTMADFVTGRTQEQQINGFPTSDFKYYQYSFYLQDAWKVSRRLTVTYGIRFDHMGNWFPASGPGLAVWDWASYKQPTPTAACSVYDQLHGNSGCSINSPAWTGMQYHAINSKIPMSGFPSRMFFPEPRIGVAYDLFGNGKTVLRGGFGLYRYQLAYNSVSGGAFTAPLGYLSNGGTWCETCIGYTGFGASSDTFQATSTGVGNTTGRGGFIQNLLQQGDTRTPHTYTFNVTISQRVPWNSVAEFQYSGNRSRDMMINNNWNFSNYNRTALGAYFRPNPLTGANPCATMGATCADGLDVRDYYPLWAYAANSASTMTLVTHGSYSNYNAFIATWQKQTGRTTFMANYTFSKVLGIRDGQTDNGAGQGAAIDSYNMKTNYGVLAFDHTHIFNAAYVINLPSPVHSNVLAKGIVNGWELSGVTQFQSGAPIQPNTGGTLNVNWPSAYTQANWLGTNMNANAGVVPRVTCDPRQGLSSGQYFNPACFAPPSTRGQNGDIIWPYIKGPGYISSDLSIYKNFNFGEHHQIQFRAQAVNFLNHPNADLSLNSADLNLSFNNNNVISQTNTNASTNGKAANTGGRRVMMLSLKYSF